MPLKFRTTIHLRRGEFGDHLGINGFVDSADIGQRRRTSVVGGCRQWKYRCRGQEV